MTRTAFVRLGSVLVVALLLPRAPARAAADVLLRAADATSIHGAWAVVADSTAAGGSRLANPDRGQPKPGTPLAAPADYFELTFTAEAAVPYRVWVRARAHGDSYENDSAWLQFSDSVDTAGSPRWRIGTTSATSVVLEDCVHCGVSGWGWQDNGYGGFGEPVRFAASGAHTLRVQVREDGLSIDQIVLSAVTYFDAAPGAPRNDDTIVAGGLPVPPPVPIVRGPYLQQTGPDGVTIVWATRDAGFAAAEVGGVTFEAATGFHSASVTGLPDYYQHEAAVRGLAPATTYAYRLTSGGSPITSGADLLTTAPVRGTGAVRFIAFGDSGVGSSEQQSLASRMNDDTFDFAVLTGDIAYGDSSGAGAASHATYDDWFFDVYTTWLRRRPVFPSMGNHDSREANDWGRAYRDLFVLPSAAGVLPDDAERYYSVDYGPVHLVVIDTERAFQDPARRAAQLAWLEADLSAAAGQPWRIAVLHRPPFNSGARHGSEIAVRDALAPLFERYGVQLVLSGHEHLYERSVPWRTGSNAATQAVTYLVTGGGGPLYPAGADEWTARSASAHHYVRVTVDGCRATLEAVPIAGSAFDAHVLDRCAQAADGAPPSVSFVAPAEGATVSGVVTVEAHGVDDIAIEKVDLYVDGRLHGIDTTPPYAFAWDTGPAGSGMHVLTLRAHDVDGRRDERQRTVAVAGSNVPDGLPPGWQSADIGPVSLTGSAAHASGSFVVTGAGADIWGTSDAFRFVYRPLEADGTITARVAALSGSNPWAKAGVMIRASTAAGSPHAFSLVSLGHGTAFQRRTGAGGLTSHTWGPAQSAPQWVRLTRAGTRVTAAVSADGNAWTIVGTDTIAWSGPVLAGLALTSHADEELAVATFDAVSLTAPNGLPAGWQAEDVGPVGPAGTATHANGTFTVTGAGADIWGTADAFHFAWRTLDGDGAIAARVSSLTGPDDWTKAGVMMRATTGAASPHAFMLISAENGLAFQRRTATGALSTHSGLAGAAPAWVRLVREGQTIIGSASVDGTSWIEVGRDTIAAGSTLHVGLAVTSHDAARTATATFEQVMVTDP